VSEAALTRLSSFLAMVMTLFFIGTSDQRLVVVA